MKSCISKCEIRVTLGLFTHIAILEQTQTLEQNWVYRVVRRWCRGDVLLVSIPNRLNTCRTLPRRIWRASEHRVKVGNHNDSNNNEWCLSMFVGFCLSVMTISCNSASWLPLIDLFLKLFWHLNEFIRLRITSSVRPSMGEPGGGGGVSTFLYGLPLAPVLPTQTLSSHTYVFICEIVGKKLRFQVKILLYRIFGFSLWLEKTAHFSFPPAKLKCA